MMTPAIRRSTLAAACLGLTLMTGCSLFEYRPEGNMRSDDQFTYVSTAFMPITVTLLDTRTMEQVWSVDVPVGQKLTLNFLEDRSRDAGNDSDTMQWAMHSEDEFRFRLENEISVPPATARRIDVAHREVPEVAGAD